MFDLREVYQRQFNRKAELWKLILIATNNNQILNRNTYET
jgi:hypothetical protein